MTGMNGHGGRTMAAQLSDLVPITRTVQVNGADFVLYPITITQLARMLATHPGLIDALALSWRKGR